MHAHAHVAPAVHAKRFFVNKAGRDTKRSSLPTTSSRVFGVVVLFTVATLTRAYVCTQRAAWRRDSFSVETNFQSSRTRRPTDRPRARHQTDFGGNFRKSIFPSTTCVGGRSGCGGASRRPRDIGNPTRPSTRSPRAAHAYCTFRKFELSFSHPRPGTCSITTPIKYFSPAYGRIRCTVRRRRASTYHAAAGDCTTYTHVHARATADFTSV